MFNRVSCFQESEREPLYAERSRGSDCGPILGCRHPVEQNVEQNARPMMTKASSLVMSSLKASIRRSSVSEVALRVNGSLIVSVTLEGHRVRSRIIANDTLGMGFKELSVVTGDTPASVK